MVLGDQEQQHEQQQQQEQEQPPQRPPRGSGSAGGADAALGAAAPSHGPAPPPAPALAPAPARPPPAAATAAAAAAAATPQPPPSRDAAMWKHLQHLNVFVLCKFLRVLGHVMVLLVLGIIGFTWYAVVPVVYGPLMVQGPPGRALGASLLVVVFSALVAMLTWSYFAAVLTDPGRVPAGWHPFPDEAVAARELELMQYADYYIDRRDPRRPRFCKHCKAWKPERAHHCSVSGRCVLKMDHYCIWVVNCVGLLNYKFFLQFLGYTFAASLLTIAAMVQPMLVFFAGAAPGAGSAIAFVAVVVNSAFAVSLAGFLIMHGNMLAANCTTIEMYEKDRIHPWPYNKGGRRNFEEVFGKSKLRWLLPCYTAEERRALLDSCLNVRLLQYGTRGGGEAEV